MLHLSDEVCVEMLANDQGYQCFIPDVQTTLSMKCPAEVTPGQLDDYVQQYIDRVYPVSMFV